MLKENKEKKTEKEVLKFDERDLDEGLDNKRSEVLKNLKLPLPKNLMNEKLEDVLFYQKNAEVQLNYFADLLTPNKAIIYKENGMNKAIKKIRIQIEIQENKLKFIIF